MTSTVGFRPPPIGDDDLHAYVDGQLDGGHRSAIEAHLAARPEDAARAAAYRGQNIALHALFDPCLSAAPDTPAVDELGQRLAAALHRQRRFRRTVKRLAASAAVVVSVGAVVWSYPGPVVWRGGAERTAVAEVEPGPPALQQPAALPAAVAASPSGPTAPTVPGTGRWLAERLGGEHPQWPDLRPLGLRLVGERAAAVSNGLAVQFAYEDADGRGFVLHVELDRGELAPVLPPPRVRGEEVAFFWRSGPLVLGLVGEAPRAELLAVAEAVAAQLSPITVPGPAPGHGRERLLPAGADPAAPADADDPAGTPPVGAPGAEVVQEAGVNDAVVEPAPEAAAAGDGETDGSPAEAPTAPPPPAADDTGDAGAASDGSRPLSGLPPPRIERA